mgnify:CR=1 FL=1
MACGRLKLSVGRRRGRAESAIKTQLSRAQTAKTFPGDMPPSGVGARRRTYFRAGLLSPLRRLKYRRRVEAERGRALVQDVLLAEVTAPIVTASIHARKARRANVEKCSPRIRCFCIASIFLPLIPVTSNTSITVRKIGVRPVRGWPACRRLRPGRWRPAWPSARW